MGLKLFFVGIFVWMTICMGIFTFQLNKKVDELSERLVKVEIRTECMWKNCGK